MAVVNGKPLALASLVILVAFICHLPMKATATAPFSSSVLDSVRRGESQDVIVEFDVASVRFDFASQQVARRHGWPLEAQLDYKREGYAAAKQATLDGLIGVSTVHELPNLSVSIVRLDNEAALNALAARSGVVAIVEKSLIETTLIESLPLIEQPAPAAAGVDGTGAVIAILDTGVDISHADLGSCTAPAVPASCRVLVTAEIAADDGGFPDTSGHGTNVSAIAAQTAPGARLIVGDVFDPVSPNTPDVLLGIDWAIALKPYFNIVALNLSLSSNQPRSTTDCSAPPYTFASAFQDALDAGIQPVASSGNKRLTSGVFQDGISEPGCTPGAISVGAVHDFPDGTFTFFLGMTNQCNQTMGADVIACFSQSGANLDLLAPGALITAGGATGYGTSQAAPHVSAAWAVLKQGDVWKTDAELLALLKNTGVPRLDSQNSVTRSRVNLSAALDEDGDAAFTPDDNCTLVQNSPGFATGCDSQEDGDLDGFGNPCDTDTNNNGATDLSDVADTLAQSKIGGTLLNYDFDCNGSTSLNDVSRAIADSKIGKTPGPTGLACADPLTAGACP